MRYSEAPRCPACDLRAILDRQAAQRLVAASSGVLAAFNCPDGLGVHVWNPDFERGRHNRLG